MFQLREKNVDVGHKYLKFGKRLLGKGDDSDLGHEKQWTPWNSDFTNTTAEDATIANGGRPCGSDGEASWLC